LLAILALAGAKGITRDRILGVLWPETDQDRARQSLSQAIYSLRRDLGVDVATGASGLRLDPQQMSSDVGDFRAAIAGKRWAEAAELYQGPFLDGFYLADAPEFERWAETERGSLGIEGIRAIETVAKLSAEEGRLDEAAEYWRRLTRLEPGNSRIAASYMEALAALGDRAGAIAHGRLHTELLRRDFEAEPDRTFERLMSRLRESSVTGEHVAARGPVGPKPASPVGHPAVPEPLPPPPVPKRAVPGTRAAVIAGALVAVCVLAIIGWRSVTAPKAPVRPILAVGRIRDLVGTDSSAFGGVSSEMLATSLSRLGELQVIANSRMLELTPRNADTSRVALNDAARRAGATEIIEGELIPQRDQSLRLELRRVDIGQGLVRRGYRVIGRDRTAVFDSVTTLIASDLRLGAPTGSLADVSTSSPNAYRLYEQGIRILYQVDTWAAYDLFRQAIKEDSSFAMATYYAWFTARLVGHKDEEMLAERAFALAPQASTRDRLTIIAHIGAVHAELRSVPAAESLAALYPRDPEALIRAAGPIQNLKAAAELLNRSIALDSAADPGASPICRLCNALSDLTARYQWADSAQAVEQTMARWLRFRPKDPAPWAVLADWHTGFGRRAEAEDAQRRFEALGGRASQSYMGHLIRSIRWDEYDAANRDCASGLASPDTTTFLQYRWFCVIALRTQGRFREARALLREGRVPNSSIARPGLGFDVYQQAQVDMEMGNGRAAADGFLSIPLEFHDAGRPLGGLRARYTTWVLTLGATAAIEGGDTTRARRLIDTIQFVGQRSLFPRDPLLHHFVRGTLLSRENKHEEAVRELRAAMNSPTFGYTRINYELGKSLLALKRPAEAIPLLQSALHGGIEGSCLYVTRTELHELIARLFDANNQRDSAAAHYAIVERAWRSADPILQPKYQAAKEWLARSK
jgi:DNA-binding SARP family transcriptional activator/TolB-like protein